MDRVESEKQQAKNYSPHSPHKSNPKQSNFESKFEFHNDKLNCAVIFFSFLRDESLSLSLSTKEGKKKREREGEDFDIEKRKKGSRPEFKDEKKEHEKNLLGNLQLKKSVKKN